jgi:dihydroxycyclohexadiene carboxylate dehydrogenase
MAGLDPKQAGRVRLKDKVCVVTGAGQGIGRAVARRMGEEGGRIVVAERVDESATRTTEELTKNGITAIKALADVSTYSGAQSLMQTALDAFGRVDVLVNNVGGTIWIQPFHEFTEEQIHLELQRSLHTTLFCCHAVLPIMIKQQGGAIVNVGSQSPRGLYRLPYATSKGGVIAMTKVLAMEYGRYNIRVNCVSPGGTAVNDMVTTRLTIKPGEVAKAPESEQYKGYREEMYNDIRNQQALKRSGTPDEQAAAIAFLASDDASFITGDVINCSGGQG